MVRTSTGRIFFPGLDALRCVAALSVLVSHVGQFQVQMGYTAPGWFHRLFLTGYDAVVLFFVLSGFLITYLLLAEDERRGAIDIRRFYARRALRIWPLYFLLVGVAFAVWAGFGTGIRGWPQPHDGWIFVPYLLLLANVALSYGGIPLGISQTWSIAVEEQFYAVWPWALRLFKHRLVTFMLALIALKLVVLTVLVEALPITSPTIGLVQELAFESLALGALSAVLVFRGSAVLRVVYHPVSQLLTVAALVAVVYTHDDVMTHWRPVGTGLMSLVFALLILNVGCNDRTLLRIGNPVADYLGRISYGIYMFHPFVIYGLVYAFWTLEWDPGRHVGVQVGLYAAAILGTIAIAALSYRYFELPFLRFKKRLARVESGGDTIAVGGFAGPPAVAAQRAT